METRYKNTLIRLFNVGKLTLTSAEWFFTQGYAIICGDGKVVDIVQE